MQILSFWVTCPHEFLFDTRTHPTWLGFIFMEGSNYTSIGYCIRQVKSDPISIESRIIVNYALRASNKEPPLPLVKNKTTGAVYTTVSTQQSQSDQKHHHHHHHGTRAGYYIIEYEARSISRHRHIQRSSEIRWFEWTDQNRHRRWKTHSTTCSTYVCNRSWIEIGLNRDFGYF